MSENDPKRKIPVWMMVVAALGVLLFAVGVTAAIAANGDHGEPDAGVSPSPSPSYTVTRTFLSKAYDNCFDAGEGELLEVTLSDNETTLLINGAGTPLADPELAYTECIKNYLSTPDSVWGRVMNTRALDGTQEGEWVGPEEVSFTASWTFHPDDGLNMVITEAR